MSRGGGGWLPAVSSMARLAGTLLVLAVQAAFSITCPRPGPELLTGHHKHKDKSCPDFKDKETQKFCCPSSIEPGSFYCCSQEDMEKLEAEERRRAWREFFANYIGQIIAAALFTAALIFCLAYIICRRYCLTPRECRWYSQEGASCSLAPATSEGRPSARLSGRRWKRSLLMSEGSTSASSSNGGLPSYRPVDINAKIYDAPPPYEQATRSILHPPPQAITDQQRNDWHCLIENEVNNGRPFVPSLPPPPF